MSASAAPLTRSVRPPFTVTSITPVGLAAVFSATEADAGAGNDAGSVGPPLPMISHGMKLPAAADSSCLRHV